MNAPKYYDHKYLKKYKIERQCLDLKQMTPEKGVEMWAFVKSIFKHKIKDLTTNLIGISK